MSMRALCARCWCNQCRRNSDATLAALTDGLAAAHCCICASTPSSGALCFWSSRRQHRVSYRCGGRRNDAGVFAVCACARGHHAVCTRQLLSGPAHRLRPPWCCPSAFLWHALRPLQANYGGCARRHRSCNQRACERPGTAYRLRMELAPRRCAPVLRCFLTPFCRPAGNGQHVNLAAPATSRTPVDFRCRWTTSCSHNTLCAKTTCEHCTTCAHCSLGKPGQWLSTGAPQKGGNHMGLSDLELVTRTCACGGR